VGSQVILTCVIGTPDLEVRARYLDADGSRLGAFVLNTCSQDPISLIFPPAELCTGQLVLSILPRSLVAEGCRQRGDDWMGIYASLRRR
jgi:hypothetical protein